MKKAASHISNTVFLLVPLIQPWLAPMAMALPQGAEVRQGQVNIAEDAQRMVIQQSSDRAVIDYDDFSIDVHEQVQILQPNSQSILLNRVRQGGPLSEIHGQLQANGQVFLVNPAGILVGANAQIDVGGLLLTTHHIDEHQFLANQFSMTASSPSVIQIDGRIAVEPGSFVMVVAPQIELSGDIIAQFGKVSLIAADGATVLVQRDVWPNIQVTQAAYEAWIHHHGLIDAQGGLVELTAASASDLIDRVVFHEGITDVSTPQLIERDGRVFIEKSLASEALVAGDAPDPINKVVISTQETKGYVDLAGTIDASGDGLAKTIDITAEAIFVRPDTEVLNNGVVGDAGETRLISNYLQVDEGAKFEVIGGSTGDGGFIELSGRININLAGGVDLSAPAGKPGTLLIDPRNLTITDSFSTSITNPTGQEFRPTANNANLNAASIIQALNSGNVIVTTEDDGTGTQVGDLSLQTNLNLDGLDNESGVNTLTLIANGTLTLAGNIEDQTLNNPGGNANIILQATRDIEMQPGTRINAGTGTISVFSTEADFIVTQLISAAADTTALTVELGGSLIDSNGDNNNISLTGANAIFSLSVGSFADQLEGFAPIFRATGQDIKGFSQTSPGNLQISMVNSTLAPLNGFEASTVDGDIIVRGLPGENMPGLRVGELGRLRLTAGGAGSSILADSNISTGTGSISLIASTGAITMDKDAVIDSTSGAVALTSNLDQTIGLISTGSNSNSAISLEVTGSNFDIIDAHEEDNDTVNLRAINGGLTLVNVDDFAGLETNINRFTSENLNVSNIVLNEANDLIVQQILGANTNVSLVVGGEARINSIDTGGSVSIQANRISEFYQNPADEIAKINQASIAASEIELIATTSIGNIANDSFAVLDYLDIDTTALRVEMLGEVNAVNANEVAIQQVSSQAVGDLVISEVLTPNQPGVAKIFFAALNNNLDVSQLVLDSTALQLPGAVATLDSSDVLGLKVGPSLNENSVAVLLPSLNKVQDWTLGGLVLEADSPNSSITTTETAGAQVLNTLATGIKQLVWSSNQAINLNFSGTDLDLVTSTGDITVNATGALNIRDLNGDDLALVTENGNLNVTANGNLSVADTVRAVDGLNDNIRAGLIDIATNAGNIVLGPTDLTLMSINENDSDLDTGLGTKPTQQTAIRIAQNNPTGTASITIGSETSTVSITAQGGDIYMASGARSVTRDLTERNLIIFDETVIKAFNLPSDPLSSDNTILEFVNYADNSPSAPVIQASAGRKIELTYQNIEGFNLSPEREAAAETAVDDAIRTDPATESSIVPIDEEQDDSNTRMNVMLDTVVPECDSSDSDSLDGSINCVKQQGFKEFLRSLVLGRGFPNKYKGLPE